MPRDDFLSRQMSKADVHIVLCDARHELGESHLLERSRAAWRDPGAQRPEAVHD
jgi:hypothetical protein